MLRLVSFETSSSGTLLRLSSLIGHGCLVAQHFDDFSLVLDRLLTSSVQAMD